MLTFGAIAQRYRPRWLVWENVPGVLSSNGGRDFAAFLGTLEELGYGWGYRILDAEYFGVAQRRRRVFVVGYLGDWRRAAAVLFERESLCGHPAPSREKGERVAASLTSGAKSSGGIGYDNQALFSQNGDNLVRTGDVARTLTKRYDSSEDGTGRGLELVVGPMSAAGGTDKKHGHGWGQQDWENGYIQPVSCYENHAQDSRIKDCGDLSPQLNAKAGTGGNNLPLVMAHGQGGTEICSDVFCIKGAAIGRKPEAGPQYGEILQDGTAYTLNCVEQHAVCMAHGQGGTEVCSDGEPSLTCNHEAPICFENHAQDSRVKEIEVASPHAKAGTGGGNLPIVLNNRQDPVYDEDLCQPLGMKDNGMAVAYPINTLTLGGRPDPVNDARMTIGVGEEGDPQFTPQAAHSHAVAFIKGDNNGSTQETNAGALLRILRKEIGEEAFAKWVLGILDSLQPKEILRQALHGSVLRPAAFSRSWVVYCSLSRKEGDASWLLQSLRETGCPGCPPQGWEPSEQLTRELGAYLSGLSQPGAQVQRFMHDMWSASEGIGLLRQALSEIQEVGRSAHREGQSAHQLQVRRLTATECEFLQGFPRGYTNIPWRNKPESPDGPRYKALGNSMAVPVMRWIGERIQLVENMKVRVEVGE